MTKKEIKADEAAHKALLKRAASLNKHKSPKLGLKLKAKRK